MVRIYFTDEGRIITEYAVNGQSSREIGRSSSALVKTRHFIAKGKKVILIDKEESPGIVVMALSGEVEKDNITRGEKYTSKDGFDVIWSPNNGSYNTDDYNCIISVQKALV